MPLTNCVFNKSGDRFITGSYDRLCKIWDSQTGNELLTLSGHENVVYALAFNNPFGDKILTGSFDKTAKVLQYHISFLVTYDRYGIRKQENVIIHYAVILVK